MSLRTLYAGVSGPLVTVGLVQSANFALYDSIRRIFHRIDEPTNAAADPSEYIHKDALKNVALSSMVAGGILACVTSPLVLVKTKQQMMTWDFRRAVQETLSPARGARGSLANFYVGFAPHFLSETIGRGVYFYCYEAMKRECAKQRGAMDCTLQERMACAGLSGMASWAVIFPLDTLKSRMLAQSLSSQAMSCTEMASCMYKETNSFRSFYRGFGVTLLRSGPVAAAVLPVYDMTLEWLNKHREH